MTQNLSLQRSKMNYRAWYHRCWLVSYMTTEQVRHIFLILLHSTGSSQVTFLYLLWSLVNFLQSLHELQRSKKWAGLHVADHSCFHYRRVGVYFCFNMISRFPHTMAIIQIQRVTMAQVFFLFPPNHSFYDFAAANAQDFRGQML